MYELISVDDHIIEPPRVWADRLPAKFQEAGPHVIDEGGREWWVYEGNRVDTMGLNAVAGKPQETWNMDPVRYTDMIQGCWDPVQRAKDMALDGVVGSVEAEPRVLPFPECPAAADAVSALVGSEVRSLARVVPDTLTGIASCTHLNDLLRALGGVGGLLSLADGG